MARLDLAVYGLLLAGLGHLAYALVQFRMGSFNLLFAAVTGLALWQAAAGRMLGGETGRQVLGVGLVLAGLASLPDLRGVLWESVNLITIGGFVEGIGLIAVGVAGGILLWARNREEEGDLVLRTGAGVSAASGLLYMALTIPTASWQWVPGNLLILVGLGLVAWRWTPLDDVPEDEEGQETEAAPEGRPA